MDSEIPDWPRGARCAVVLSFDNFGESYDLLRYGYAGGANADGVYAPRRGVPRILNLLEKHDVPATFFVEGWNAQKYSALAREVVEHGHEVAGHGWMHETWNELTIEQEIDLIDRTTSAITDSTGIQPIGWRAPAGLITPDTLALLSEAGYKYDSSFGDDDVPYRVAVAATSDVEIVEIPWSWSSDDAPYYKHPGVIRRPSDMIDIWIDEFNAARELVGFYMVICHPRYSGRPARVRELERLIEHIKSHDDIWFARCQDVAEIVQNATAVPSYPAPERW